MKKLIYIAALAGTLSLTGCEDFLTPENKGAVTEDYFSTTAGIKSLVYDAYTLLGANAENRIMNSSDAPALFNAGTDMYTNGRSDCSEALHRWSNFTPENGTVKTFYAHCYDVIRSCTAIVYYSNGSTVPVDVVDKATDEGRVIASFCYYLLVNNFGGVPLVKEFTPVPKDYPRATAEEVYNYIISELKDVIARKNLDATTAKEGGGEVSIETAKALLAKTYLSAAWDLNKPEYFTEAAKLADEVINGRELTTTGPDFAKLWAADGSGDNNEEFIWDVEYDSKTALDNNKGNRWQNLYCNYYGGKEEGMKNGASSYVPTKAMLGYFEKGDKRYDATFMRELLLTKNIDPDFWDENTLFQETYLDGNGNEKTRPYGAYFAWYTNGKKSDGKYVGVYYPAPWETDAEIDAWKNKPGQEKYRKNTFILKMAEKTSMMEPKKDYWSDIKDGKHDTHDWYTALAKTWTCAPCRKFDDSNTHDYNAGKSFRDIHIITLPEMFFVAAEAYLKAGDNTNALARLNSVRKRAGLPDATEISIDAILKESACEMYGNGYRRMDLRRTQKLVEYNNLYNPDLEGNAEATIAGRLLWPIPQAAIDANKLLTDADQNPGY